MRKTILVLMFLVLSSHGILSQDLTTFFLLQQSNCHSQGGDWEGMTCAPGGRPATPEERAQFQELSRNFINSLVNASQSCALQLYITEDITDVGIIAERFLEWRNVPNDNIVVFRTTHTPYTPEGGYLITNDIISAEDSRRLQRANDPRWDRRCWNLDVIQNNFEPVAAGVAVIEQTQVPGRILKDATIDWLTQGELGQILEDSTFLDGNDFISSDERDYTLVHLLDLLNAEELEIIRSEIYARRGLIFNSPHLTEYFQTKNWYDPRYESIRIHVYGNTGRRDFDLSERIIRYELEEYENNCEIEGGSHRMCTFSMRGPEGRERLANLEQCLLSGESFEHCRITYGDSG